MKRFHIFAIAALLAVTCVFASCKKKQPVEQETETEQVEEVETTDEVELVVEATAEQ